MTTRIEQQYRNAVEWLIVEIQLATVDESPGKMTDRQIVAELVPMVLDSLEELVSSTKLTDADTVARLTAVRDGLADGSDKTDIDRVINFLTP